MANPFISYMNAKATGGITPVVGRPSSGTGVSGTTLTASADKLLPDGITYGKNINYGKGVGNKLDYTLDSYFKKTSQV